jgi:hypothetical protein
MITDFTLLKGDYSIYRFNKDSKVPCWVYDSDLYSVTKTEDELSIVCETVYSTLNDSVKIDWHWRILKINGPLDLSQVGIIADISSLFKDNKIPIFTISTFDTDYILVKTQYLDKTITLLTDAGNKILINS